MELLPSRHHHDERRERVEHRHRVALRRQHIRQAPVRMRRLVQPAAPQDHALPADPLPPPHSRSMSHVTFPGLITSPVLRFTFPRAAVRDITRPAPCTVEYSEARCRSESCRAPSMITALSPIEPPTKPCCPGNAGVAPLRTTTYSVPACVSFQAKLWWLCTSSTSSPPRSSTTLRATHSRPA